MSNDPFGQPPLFDDGDVFSLDIPVDAGKPAWFIEAGEYIARLVDLERGTSRNSNPQIIWTYAIVKASPENQAMLGKEIKDFTTLTAAAMWRVTQTLDALGVPYVPGQPLQLSRAALISTQVGLVIEEGEWGGRPQSRIARVFAIEDSTAKMQTEITDLPA